MSRRPARRALAALALAGIGLSAAACSSSGSSAALERTACVDVHRSLALYAAAAAEHGAAATRTRERALLELRDALSPAALASSDDSTLQALTATLSETSRVPEGQLVTALRAQCAAVPGSG